MSKHSEISPSNFERIYLCPASLRLSLDLPNVVSEYALEGTMLHSEFEHYATKYSFKNSLTSEQQRAVLYAYNILEPYILKSSFFIEEKVNISDVYNGIKGTIDFGSYSICDIKKQIYLHVCDLKFGKGVIVRAYKNMQLFLYMIGFFKFLQSHIHRDIYSSYKVSATLRIIQPFIDMDNLENEDNIWVIENVREAIKTGLPKLKKAVDNALKPNAPTKPSEKACKFCKAKTICPALNDLNSAIAELKTKTPKVEELTNEKIGEILNRSSEVETYIAAVKKLALERVINNEKINGWMLGQGRRMRKYLSHAEDVLVSHLGDQAYEKSLIGITTADKLISKDIMNSICEKTEGKQILVRDNSLEIEKLLNKGD